MNKAALRLLSDQCKRSGLHGTLAIALLSDEESSDEGDREEATQDPKSDFASPDVQSPQLSSHSTVLLELVTGEFEHDPLGAITAARQDLRTVRRQDEAWAAANLERINAILSAAARRRVAHRDPQAAKADLIRGLKKQLSRAQTAIRSEKEAVYCWGDVE